MNLTSAAERLPGFLRKRFLHFETDIQRAVGEFAKSLADGVRVLDAGAGESRFASLFKKQEYLALDLGIGDRHWDFSRLDVIADLAALPLGDATCDAVISVVTLEHVPDPLAVVCDLERILRPGGRLLVIVPQQWEIHQAPHDYYRYTRHGMEHLLKTAGFASWQIEASGGYFHVLARQILNSIKFFRGGVRWAGFIPAALVAASAALCLPCLSFLDKERNFTLGYICTARKDDKPL